MKKKRELEMYKIQDVVQALIEQTPIKSIARKVKISKNTVKKYKNILNTILINKPNIKNDINLIMQEFNNLRKQEKYSNNFGWLSNKHELLNELITKSNNYLLLVEQLHQHGFKGSYSSLIRYIEKSKIFSNKKIVIRMETKPGDVAQVDFGNIGLIWDSINKKQTKAYVFAMTLGFSRLTYFEIVKSQNIETWCNCHIHAFEYFGGVPKYVIPDNLKSAVIKASFVNPTLNRTYKDLAKHYNFQIEPCIPGTPEHKGKVESAVKYVKNNFMPFKKFYDFSDANNQLSNWIETKSNVRIHGTTREKPIELFNKYEKEKLSILSQKRFEIPIYKNLKVYRDTHIQLEKAYYSVPYEYTGEEVLVRKTGSLITIFIKDKVIATHFPLNSGKRSTKIEHLPPNQYKYIKEDKTYCVNVAKKIGENTYKIIELMLLSEPIFNLRGAQNILRLTKKYTNNRLENACKRALYYNAYDYYTIKNILEKELDLQLDLFLDIEMKIENTNLDDTFAKKINNFLTEVVKIYGNHNAIKN